MQQSPRNDLRICCRLISMRHFNVLQRFRGLHHLDPGIIVHSIRLRQCVLHAYFDVISLIPTALGAVESGTSTRPATNINISRTFVGILLLLPRQESWSCRRWLFTTFMSTKSSSTMLIKSHSSSATKKEPAPSQPSLTSETSTTDTIGLSKISTLSCAASYEILKWSYLFWYYHSGAVLASSRFIERWTNSSLQIRSSLPTSALF